MTIHAFAFYVFATIVVASGALTILSRNPVHSVLWLILAFFNAAGLMLLVGAEFIAMLLVIVYVGAVAVLFLFVVMMLDIDFAELRAGFTRYLPFGGLIALVLFAEIVLAIGVWNFADIAEEARLGAVDGHASDVHHLLQGGQRRPVGSSAAETVFRVGIEGEGQAEGEFGACRRDDDVLAAAAARWRGGDQRLDARGGRIPGAGVGPVRPRPLRERVQGVDLVERHRRPRGGQGGAGEYLQDSDLRH